MPLFLANRSRTRESDANQAEAKQAACLRLWRAIADIGRQRIVPHDSKRLVADLDTHLTSRAANGAKGRFFAASVEVLHFHLHDVHHLLF